jgi:phospholipase C
MKRRFDNPTAAAEPAPGPFLGMERREFLKRAGLVAGAVTLGSGALAACSGKSPSVGFDSIVNHPPTESKVDTVVVVMMENRSFDHYLGWLGRDEQYLETGRSRYGKRFHIKADNRQHYADPLGQVFATQHLKVSNEEPAPFRGCDHAIPGHGWNTGRAQRDLGFLGKDTGNDQFAIGYYDDSDLKLYQQLAPRFTICDQWHSSLLAGTFPNRQYLHSASSEGRKEDPIPLDVGIYKNETIWDRLDAENVSSRYYYTDLPILTLWGPRLYDKISKIDDYFTDAQAGTLPHFVMVDPPFQGVNRADDHPQGDVRMGQKFVREVLKAFVQSPQWERGMFVLIYDEWGGFFDHVPPAQFPDERSSPDNEEDFGQGGFRVPAMVISPWARPGAVDHTVYDHTAVMRFLEWRFMGAPATGPKRRTGRWWLTARDRGSRNLGGTLGLETPQPDLGFDIDLDLDFVAADCETPALGAPLGGPGDTPLSEELQALTNAQFPDAEAQPWIGGLLPGNRIPRGSTSTSSPTTTTTAPSS